MLMMDEFEIKKLLFTLQHQTMTEMAKKIKIGDFVNDFGFICYVAYIDHNYEPARVILVDLKGEMLMQDINSLELMSDDQLSDADLIRMKEWSERVTKRYKDIIDQSVPIKETQNPKI